MASMEKYTDNQVLYKLKHVTRESGKLPSNIDIDHAQSAKNYSLTPSDRGTTAAENRRYYNQRIKEVYKYGRSDVNTAVQWVITAPKNLPAEQEKAFFLESYRYLNSSRCFLLRRSFAEIFSSNVFCLMIFPFLFGFIKDLFCTTGIKV